VLSLQLALCHTFTCARRDQIPLVLGCGRQDMGGELPGRVLGVYVWGHEHKTPVARSRPGNQPGEVCYRSRQTVQPHRHKRVRPPGVQLLERVEQARASRVGPTQTLVLQDVYIPAASSPFGKEERALSVQA
jgi:hypothetical protein